MPYPEYWQSAVKYTNCIGKIDMYSGIHLFLLNTSGNTSEQYYRYKPGPSCSKLNVVNLPLKFWSLNMGPVVQN